MPDALCRPVKVLRIIQRQSSEQQTKNIGRIYNCQRIELDCDD